MVEPIVHYAEEGLSFGDMYPLCENAQRGDGMSFFPAHVTCQDCARSLTEEVSAPVTAAHADPCCRMCLAGKALNVANDLGAACCCLALRSVLKCSVPASSITDLLDLSDEDFDKVRVWHPVDGWVGADNGSRKRPTEPEDNGSSTHLSDNNT